jgi:superfamily II DNA or RNA helicase
MNQLLDVEDVTHHIFNFLPEKDLHNVLLVNRQFYKLIMIYFGKKYNKNYLSEYYPTIFPEQCYAIKKLKQIRKVKNKCNHQKYIVKYNSPMGTGKTATTLYMALMSNKHTLIVIPPKTLGTWLGETKKFNLYDTNPEKSNVLFYHASTNKRHHQQVEKSLNSGTETSQKIIIITFAKFYKYTNQYQKNINKEYNIIVDEAHLMVHYPLFGYYANTNKYRELLLVSASPITRINKINSQYIELKCPRIHINKDIIGNRINVDNVGGKYAKLSYKYLWSDIEYFQEGTYYGNYNYIKDYPNFSKLLDLPNIRNYKKIILFSSTPIQRIRQFVKKYKNNLEDYYLIAFNNQAKTHLDTFRKKEKCIVLCNYLNSIEGVNFSEADCAIYLDFNYNTPEKSKQALGRVERKNNLHSNIDIYFVNRNLSLSYIRCRLNQIYAFNTQIKGMDKKREQTMTKIRSILKEKKYKLTDLTDDEMLLLFSTGSYDFNNLDIKMDMKDLLPLTYLL